MAIRTTAEILEMVSSLVGESPDDEKLTLLEDISDTLAERTAPAPTEDWKAKYEELDKSWRERYRARFLEWGEEPRTKIEVEVETPRPEDAPKTFEELFKEVN